MTKLLQDMTWEEAKEAFKTVRLGIIPTGSMEQHGPHLPVGTDFLIADRLAKGVAEKTDAIVTPTIPIGFASYHQDFEGTLAVTPEHLAAYYLDVVNSLLLFGVTHVLFINGHGGNAGALSTVCRDLRDRGIPSAFIQWWQVAGGINEPAEINFLRLECGMQIWTSCKINVEPTFKIVRPVSKLKITNLE